MLLKYIDVALHSAHYEFIAEDNEFYGEIPKLNGLWATGHTFEE